MNDICMNVIIGLIMYVILYFFSVLNLINNINFELEKVIGFVLFYINWR